MRDEVVMVAARSGLYPRGLVTPRCGAEPVAMASAFAVAYADLPRGGAWRVSRFESRGYTTAPKLKCIDPSDFASHGYTAHALRAF